MSRGCCIRPSVYNCYEDYMTFMSELSDDVLWCVIKNGVRCGKCGDLPLYMYIKADSTTYFSYEVMMYEVIAR